MSINSLCALVLLGVILACASEEPTLSTFEQELERLEICEAVMATSQKIQDVPIWSPDERYLCAKINGKWRTIDFHALRLGESSWRGNRRIGALKSKRSVTEISSEELSHWRDMTRWHPHHLTLLDGGAVFFLREEFGISLWIQLPGVEPQRIWITVIETCHDLSLSPTGNYVAFVCDTSGLIVASLDRLRKQEKEDRQ